MGSLVGLETNVLLYFGFYTNKRGKLQKHSAPVVCACFYF